MTVFWQIILGSGFLLGCVILHTSCLLLTVAVLKRRRKGHTGGLGFRKWSRVLGLAIIGLLTSHTIQIWLLAHATLWLGALTSLEESIYFSLVTYTTLGYGDVTLDPGFRVFGAFGAVTGLLAFGLSTALLVGLFARFLGERQD